MILYLIVQQISLFSLNLNSDYFMGLKSEALSGIFTV